MSGIRELTVEIAVTPEYSDWQIVITCPRKQSISAQEIIDAVSDALLNEGELGILEPNPDRHLDS